MTTFTSKDTSAKMAPIAQSVHVWKILKEDTNKQDDIHIEDMSTKGVSFHSGTWVDTGNSFQGTVEEVNAFIQLLSEKNDGCYSAEAVVK